MADLPNGLINRRTLLAGAFLGAADLAVSRAFAAESLILPRMSGHLV
jgi:hypothetical protein